jgi:hypothetical protein
MPVKLTAVPSLSSTMPTYVWALLVVPGDAVSVLTLMGALVPASLFSLQLHTAVKASSPKSTLFIVDSIDFWCKNSAKVACVSVLIVG